MLSAGGFFPHFSAIAVRPPVLVAILSPNNTIRRGSQVEWHVVVLMASRTLMLLQLSAQITILMRLDRTDDAEMVVVCGRLTSRLIGFVIIARVYDNESCDVHRRYLHIADW